MTLRFDMVTPAGLEFQATGLEGIVVRRREERFRPGSEVMICPGHGPLLMQTQPCEARFIRDGLTRVMSVDAGVLEVWRDQVTLVVTAPSSANNAALRS